MQPRRRSRRRRSGGAGGRRRRRWPASSAGAGPPPGGRPPRNGPPVGGPFPRGEMYLRLIAGRKSRTCVSSAAIVYGSRGGVPPDRDQAARKTGWRVAGDGEHERRSRAEHEHRSKSRCQARIGPRRGQRQRHARSGSRRGAPRRRSRPRRTRSDKNGRRRHRGEPDASSIAPWTGSVRFRPDHSYVNTCSPATRADECERRSRTVQRS